MLPTTTGSSSPHTHSLLFIAGTLLLLTLFVKGGQGLECHASQGGFYSCENAPDDQIHEESCKTLGESDRDRCIKYKTKDAHYQSIERKCACSKGLSEKYVLGECRPTENEGQDSEVISCICDKDLCNDGNVKIMEINCLRGRDEEYNPAGIDCGDMDDNKSPFVHKSCDGLQITDRNRCVAYRQYSGNGKGFITRTCACSKGLEKGGANSCSLVDDDLIRLCVCDENRCNNMTVEIVQRPPDEPEKERGGSGGGLRSTAATVQTTLAIIVSVVPALTWAYC